MPNNLTGRPFIEILILAEQSLEAGATPEITVQRLRDAGACTDDADQAVKEAILNVRKNREHANEARKEEDRHRRESSLLIIALGVGFASLGFVVDLKETNLLGFVIALYGVRNLILSWRE